MAWKYYSGACCVRQGWRRVNRGQGAMGEAVAVTVGARVWVTSPRAATRAMERCGPAADMLEGRATRTVCVHVSHSVVSVFCMVDLKSKIQEENVISRELLWTLASICHGRKFYLELNPLRQTTDEATTGLPFLV